MGCKGSYLRRLLWRGGCVRTAETERGTPLSFLQADHSAAFVQASKSGRLLIWRMQGWQPCVGRISVQGYVEYGPKRFASAEAHFYFTLFWLRQTDDKF